MLTPVLRRLDSEGGATAITIAMSMVVILGMAAVAVDAGAGFVERRADQTAVDVSSSAGGVEVLLGAADGGLTTDDMVDAALQSARSNLPTQYSDDGEWQTLWEGCVDPDRNSETGDNFEALDPPSGWTVDDPDNWCMSVDAAKSLFRVRLPDQIVATSFGRILGISELRTSAAAVVNFEQAGGGVLPFGIPVGISDGVHHCLSEPPPGLANDPCDMPDSGNFGVLKARIFGPSPYMGCNAAPTNPVLALNIAAGIDHVVVPAPDTSAANEVRDECFNFPVNTLQTDTGFPSGVEDGLATGSGLPAGETALLQQGPQSPEHVVGHDLDDAPLWSWLLAEPTPPDPPLYDDNAAPISCNPVSISTWQEMGDCLFDYVDGSYSAVIFSEDLGDREGSDWSPRFGYTPQFHENSLGPGSTWRHILRFRAIFIQGTWWKKGDDWVVHQPGEGCFDDAEASTSCTAAGMFQLKQVTSWIIPDNALPASLKGDPPNSGIIPFDLRLIR